MDHLRAVLVTSLVAISITLVPASQAMAQPLQNVFVFVPRTDSPGNDYTRIDRFTFDDCARSCDADTACNAFTCNQINSVYFLKHAANQWVTFYAWAITGIKLPSCENE